jgi:hypothetical protein
LRFVTPNRYSTAKNASDDSAIFAVKPALVKPHRETRKWNPRPNSDAASSPFPATAGPGFEGFFFSLRKAMLGMGGEPAIRQQDFQGGGF